MTGEPLSTGQGIKSKIKTADSQVFSVEYAGSEKVNFSVVSVGLAASKGTRTVIGPDMQCFVLDKHARHVRRALGHTETIKLQKKRSVYWLPVKPGYREDQKPEAFAATKAAKKVVPADAMHLTESLEAAGGTAPGQDPAAERPVG